MQKRFDTNRYYKVLDMNVLFYVTSLHLNNAKGSLFMYSEKEIYFCENTEIYFFAHDCKEISEEYFYEEIEHAHSLMLENLKDKRYFNNKLAV